MIDALNTIAMLLGYAILGLLAIDALLAFVRGFKRGFEHGWNRHNP
jgi:hypothetical protein